MPHFNRTIAAFCCLALGALALRPLPAEAKDSAKNEKLLAAVEPFEGLTETALSGDTKKVDSAFKAAEKDRAATRALLPAANATAYDKLFTALEAAQTKHDNIAMSLQDAELYKLIVSSLDSTALTIPMEVGLLDYSGMRTNALLKAMPQDWTAIAATAQEANSWWAKVSGRVTNKKLQTDMTRALNGLTNAAKSHDAALSRSSAKEDLDLVDELESFLTKATKK